MKLSELKIGQKAKIIGIDNYDGFNATRQHLLDIGIIPDSIIELVKFAPMGDPIEYKINGYILTLRKDDAHTIEVNPYDLSKEIIINEYDDVLYHPGLGEYGKSHNKKDEHPLNENHILTFALVGNQNAGKTTLFNQLTGSNQHVGNFPGVTIDKKDGVIKGYPNTLITDLPGIYSMTSYTPEETVSRDFILKEHPNGIINIVDATSIKRGFYLTNQLLELNIPMVIALNMMDEFNHNGGSIDINNLEAILGVPVVPISAAKGEGIEELIDHAIHVAKYQEKPIERDFCSEKDHNGAVHRCLHSIMYTIEDHCRNEKLPIHFCASKIAEGDKDIINRLKLDQNEIDALEHMVKQMEIERNLDCSSAIADMRYHFIFRATDKTVKYKEITKEHEFSNKLDRILTGKYTAIPIFIIIMLTMFFLTFGLIGPVFEELLANMINTIKNNVELVFINNNVSPWLQSLIIGAIFEGVGSVLSFLPIVIILFFFLSLLEDSGYMARIAFVMDSLLRKIGLSGRSIIPMIIGFGCTVPGVMSARTLPSERDRKMTILLTPFMSCSAKLPIYAFFSAYFFPDCSAIVMIVLYLVGIIMAIIVAYIFRITLFKGEAVPFVMELPNYRMPSFKNVTQLLWEKAKDFLERAFTVIFIATILIWFLQNYSIGFQMVTDQSQSILATLASKISPLFTPCGLNDWRINVALISGFLAKESIVSTIEILIGSATITQIITPLKAISLLIFSLLYVPCVAAISAIKRELGGKWALFVTIFQCTIAWVLATLVYQIGLLII